MAVPFRNKTDLLLMGRQWLGYICLKQHLWLWHNTGRLDGQILVGIETKFIMDLGGTAAKSRSAVHVCLRSQGGDLYHSGCGRGA